MKILITGAARQIGSDISKLLIKKNHEIFLLDNFRNGYIENVKENNKLIAELFEIDISNREELSKAEKKYDAIIHLAAITSLPDCEKNPKETIDINVAGTVNVIEFARKLDIPHIIFASTSAVYENTKSDLFTEDLEINPRLYYSLSKKMAEEIIETYRKNYGCIITTLRFFNVFGPTGDSNRKNPPVLNYIIKQFKNNKSPILIKNGEQRRDFIHVNDVIEMLEICLHKKPNDTFNVCTGKTISINDMARWAREALDCKHIELDYKEPEELWDQYNDLFIGKYSLAKKVVSKEAIKYSLGSYKKAQDMLGWQPNLDLESLIKKSALESKI